MKQLADDFNLKINKTVVDREELIIFSSRASSQQKM